ncbi:MAG: helix-turn-helix domain-containing protein [Gemmataceae bacterium]
MSQFYTLEEAASKLNISVDQLREMAKKREVRSFQDRGVLRFKSEDIDSRLSSAPAIPETDSADYTLNFDNVPAVEAPQNNPIGVAGNDDSEEFTLQLDGGDSPSPALSAPDGVASDSDGLLGIQDSPDLFGSDFSLSTEPEPNVAEASSTSSSVILPKESPFEISEPVIDLDDTYGLSAGSEIGISEAPIGLVPTVDDIQVDDGIGLQLDDSNATDQGLSSSIELQSPSGDDSSEFELSVEDSNSEVLSLDGPMAEEAGSGTQVVDESSSDSEFELNLDEDIGGDSGEGVVATGGDLDSSFELEPSDSDSGSQVVEVEDGQDADPMDATAEFNEVDVVEDGSSSQVVAIEEVVEEVIEEQAVEPVSEDDSSEIMGKEEEEEGAKTLVYAEETSWGALPAIFLIPGVLILFVVGLMSLELMRGMYGFNKGVGFTSVIIKPLAEMFTDMPKN